MKLILRCLVVVLYALPSSAVEPEAIGVLEPDFVAPLYDKTDKSLQWRRSQAFGDYYEAMKGYHGAEDWYLVGGASNAVVGKPVLAIADGKVVRTSDLGPGLGELIAIEHEAATDRPFVIPQLNRPSLNNKLEYVLLYERKREYVNKIVSVYIHVKIDPDIKQDHWVNRGRLIARIADISPFPPHYPPHLHFEIRRSDTKPSRNWSLIGREENWASNNKGRNGYYRNPQSMVDDGLCSPTQFLRANAWGGRNKIVFAGDVQGYGVFWMNPDGSELVRLLPSRNLNWPENDYNQWPALANSSVSSTGILAIPDKRITLVDLNTMKSRFLLDQASLDRGLFGFESLLWSPNGKKLAFWAIAPKGRYVIDQDGSNLSRVAYAGRDNVSGWTPDSQSLLCSQSTLDNYALYRVSVDERSDKQLIPGTHHLWCPVIEGAGTKIAYGGKDFMPCVADYSSGTISNPTQLLSDPLGSSRYQALELLWSVDGGQIFCSQYSGVYSIGVDGHDFNVILSGRNKLLGVVRLSSGSR